MAFLDDLTLGRYQPGASFLHRLDPRLKLLGLPLLIIAVFGALQPWRLGVLAVTVTGLVLLAGGPWRFLGRGVWLLRWLLLCTVLLHLLFSPGRTLWGTLWLSLDGLLKGLTVAGQISLALVLSSLLTLTTRPAEVAAAFAWLTRPLERLGVPSGDAARLLLLVLYFIPILREEALALHAGLEPGEQPAVAGLPRWEAWRTLSGLAAPLILRLADRAELLARELAAGTSSVDVMPPLPPWRRPGRADLLALGGGVALFTLLYGVL